MFVHIVQGSGKPTRRQIRGVWLWTVPMPMTGALAVLRRRRQWRRLRNKGIQQAVFPDILAQEAGKWGIRSVAVYPLRRAVWEQRLPQRGNAARIRAPYVDGAVRESAAVLAQRFRYLHLDTGQGTAALAQELLYRYGLGVGGCDSAEVVVSFGGRPDSEGEICLGADCQRWQNVIYANITGVEAEDLSEPLLCVLFQGGGVKKEEIQIKRVENNA